MSYRPMVPGSQAHPQHMLGGGPQYGAMTSAQMPRANATSVRLEEIEVLKKRFEELESRYQKLQTDKSSLEVSLRHQARRHARRGLSLTLLRFVSHSRGVGGRRARNASKGVLRRLQE